MNDKVIQEIKCRSLLYVVDNPKYAMVKTVIETAMMIGASIVLEQEAEETGRPREVRMENELLKNPFQPHYAPMIG